MHLIIIPHVCCHAFLRFQIERSAWQEETLSTRLRLAFPPEASGNCSSHTVGRADHNKLVQGHLDHGPGRDPVDPVPARKRNVYLQKDAGLMHVDRDYRSRHLDISQKTDSAILSSSTRCRCKRSTIIVYEHHGCIIDVNRWKTAYAAVYIKILVFDYWPWCQGTLLVRGHCCIRHVLLTIRNFSVVYRSSTDAVKCNNWTRYLHAWFCMHCLWFYHLGMFKRLYLV